MSSRTPEECVELALDDGADADDRERAIHELKLANECDELGQLVRRESLAEEYRRGALRALETPQCGATLRELVEDDDLDGWLADEDVNFPKDVGPQ